MQNIFVWRLIRILLTKNVEWWNVCSLGQSEPTAAVSSRKIICFLPWHLDPRTSCQTTSGTNKPTPSCWRLHWRICHHMRIYDSESLCTVCFSVCVYVWALTLLPGCLDSARWANSSCTEERERSASSPVSHWLAPDTVHPAPTHTHTKLCIYSRPIILSEL